MVHAQIKRNVTDWTSYVTWTVMAPSRLGNTQKTDFLFFYTATIFYIKLTLSVKPDT